MRKTDVPAIETPIVNPLFYALTATSVLCACLIAFRASQLEYVQYRFLIWNLFLAWLPLIVSMSAMAFVRGTKKRSTLTIGLLVLGIAWLLLYPNAPYLTTDFIHLIFDTKYDDNLETNLLLWYDLVLFFLFSWCGLLLGYLSMLHFHSIVSYYLNAWVGWLFVLFVSFLGGFGVYLGRAIRLNSWDVIFNPFRLIQGVIEGINRHSFVFTLLFGMMILIIYVTLYILGNYRGRSVRTVSNNNETPVRVGR